MCGAEFEIPRPLTSDGAHGTGKSDEGSTAADGEPAASEGPVHFNPSRKIPEDEVDMTPMVDVTFLLLIFFMVSAAFSLQKAFGVPAPNESEPSTQVKTVDDFEDDPNFVVLRIDAYNTFHVSAAAWDEEQEAPSKQELLSKLREARRGGSHAGGATRMLILAHGQARHERVVMALDAGTAVGMEEVKLVTVEGDE